MYLLLTRAAAMIFFLQKRLFSRIYIARLKYIHLYWFTSLSLKEQSPKNKSDQSTNKINNKRKDVL